MGGGIYFFLDKCIEEGQFYIGEVYTTIDIIGKDFKVECGDVCHKLPDCVAWMVTKSIKECKLFKTVLDSVYGGTSFISGKRYCSGKISTAKDAGLLKTSK